jgi:hypothetical protein
VAGRKSRFPKLSERDAHSALRWLHATGNVTAKQIAGALRKRDELVAEIKARLEELGGEGARFLTSVAALRRTAPRGRRKVSAKARAAWAAQGRYMAVVRQLPETARAKVASIRKAKGVQAAIREAKRIARM